MKFKKILFFSIILFLFTSSIQPKKIFFSSIPKSGTHLLSKCLMLLTNKKAKPCLEFITNKSILDFNEKFELVTWHIPFSIEHENFLKRNNFKCLFLFRDPRDQLISYIHWIIKDPTQVPFIQNEKLFPMDWNDFLLIIIKNITNFYKCYIPWIKSSLMYSIKFEDLIGPLGDGNADKQKETILNICNHLNIGYSQQTLQNCINNLFGQTETFREGKIGSWKKYFNADHKKLFKENAGQLLIDLGYEKDFNW